METLETLETLRALCPAITVETAEDELEAAGADAMRASRGRPEFADIRRHPCAVALPASTGEVAALVKWAAAGRVALVPRGGGSGLMGGAAVIGPALVVDLRRLDAVAVEAEACLVRAGAGATLAHVDAVLAPHGLILGHDPWTVGVATVGGALSTDGLGYLGARAGPIGAQVRALETVLPDGTILRSRPLPACSAGLDVTRLLIGAEGTLGIITEATLAVLPAPEERVVRAFQLPSFAAGVALAATLRRGGVRVACLELAADGLPPRPATLLLVFDGLRGEATLHAARAAAAVRTVRGRALPQGEAEEQWHGRHVIAERWAAGRRRRGAASTTDVGDRQFDYAHVGVPLGALAAVRAEAHALVRRQGLVLVEEGLWHWPELYSVVLTGPAEGADGMRAAIDGICRAAQEAGGSMEYCHGAGWKLAHLVAGELGEGGLAALRRVKAAFDPSGIMNPGKCGL